VLGRRQDTVFLELKALLEPFGITRYFTDGWGAYERHVETEQHTVGKAHTQKIESTLRIGEIFGARLYLIHQESLMSSIKKRRDTVGQPFSTF